MPVTRVSASFKRIMTIFVCLWIVLSFSYTPAQALQCRHFFTKTSIASETPVIGVIVVVENGAKYLALDSYFTGSHEFLIRYVEQSSGSSVKGLLWAGEALVEMPKEGGKIAFIAANETSGYLAARLRRTSDNEALETEPSPVDVKPATVDNIGHFARKNSYDIAVDFQGYKFDPSDFRIAGKIGLDITGVDSRHSVGNLFNILTTLLGIRAQGVPFDISGGYKEKLNILIKFLNTINRFKSENIMFEDSNLESIVSKLAEFTNLEGKVDWSKKEFMDFEAEILSFYRKLFSREQPLYFMRLPD